MAVKIRLKRMGKIRTAIYRVVVMDSRTKRDGRAIEEIGKYDPNQEPSLVEIDMERADYWVAQGAQPTEAVAALLKLYKDGTLKVAEAKPSKKDLYEAAVAAAGTSEGDDTSGATTAKKKASKKADAAVETEVANDAKADADAAKDAKADADAEVPAETAAEAEQAAAFADTTPDSVETADKAGEADVVESPAEATPATETTEAAEAEGEDAKDAKADKDTDLPKGAAAALEDGSAPEGYIIKGNKDSMKFHEPDGQWYDQTVAEVWFKTAADAEAAGFVKAGS